MSCAQSKLTPFQAGKHYLQQKYSLNKMVKRFSQVLFSTFSGLRVTNVQKWTMQSFILRVFFKLSRHEKDTELHLFQNL